MSSFWGFLAENLETFYSFTGVANATPGHLIMILVGLLFIFLAIRYEFEPMLLIPIGFGMLIGNIPMLNGLQVGIYEKGSVLNILHQGVLQGWYPPLIFLGIGAMTDFTALISNPKLMLVGAAAQFGIFAAYMTALQLGFTPTEAGAIGIIGGADGPTAIFLSKPLSSSSPRCYRCVGLLLHGSGTRDPASLHASSDDEEGACNAHEAPSSGLSDGEDHLPYRWASLDDDARTARTAPLRDALLW